MSLAQDFRNAWDHRDRDEFERLLMKLPNLVLQANLIRVLEPITDCRNPDGCACMNKRAAALYPHLAGGGCLWRAQPLSDQHPSTSEGESHS